MGRRPDLKKRERVQRLLDQGKTQAEIGRKLGAHASSVSQMIGRIQGKLSIENDFPAPYSTIDNAIKEAFRKAIGYDPIRDLFPGGHPTYDAKHHAESARQTRLAKMACGDLPIGGGDG